MSDEFEFGRLVQSVKTLTEEVGNLRADMSAIKAEMNRGKGVLIGMLLFAGGAGAAAAAAIGRLFK